MTGTNTPREAAITVSQVVRQEKGWHRKKKLAAAKHQAGILGTRSRLAPANFREGA